MENIIMFEVDTLFTYKNLPVGSIAAAIALGPPMEPTNVNAPLYWLMLNTTVAPPLKLVANKNLPDGSQQTPTVVVKPVAILDAIVVKAPVNGLIENCDTVPSV